MIKTNNIPYFQVYATDFLTLTQKLSEKEIFLIFSAISEVCLYGKTEIKIEGFYGKIFYEKLIKDLEKNKKKYLSSVNNGKKGGRPKNNPQVSDGLEMGLENKNPNETQEEPKPKATETKTKTKYKTNKKENIKRKKFQKPTLEEIKNYCLERNNQVNPEKWLNHYESNGWLVGKNPMKDWKAAVRTWESNKFDNNKKLIQQQDGIPL